MVVLPCVVLGLSELERSRPSVRSLLQIFCEALHFYVKAMESLVHLLPDEDMGY